MEKLSAGNENRLPAVLTSPLLYYHSGRASASFPDRQQLTDDAEQNIKLYKKALNRNQEICFVDLLRCDSAGCMRLEMQNATRLSGLAHDTGVYFNPDATPVPYIAISSRTRARRSPGKTCWKTIDEESSTAAGVF